MQTTQALVSKLKAENAELYAKRRDFASLKAENASLRKTIQKYLYPALADSVLGIENVATTVTPAALKELIDDAP